MTRLSPLTCCLAFSALAIGAALPAHAQEPMKPSGAIEAVMSNDTKDFFETAASANMLELQASKLALERSSDKKIKDFASKMLRDHNKAGQDLAKLAEQKNVHLPTVLLQRHQMMLDALRKQDKPHAFDDDYRDKMIESHKEAVSLFDQAAQKSDDPDVKACAAKTLPTLQSHGGMAEQLPKA